MVIKKHSSEGTVQKKNKTKKVTRNPPVTIIDEDSDAQFSLLEKAKEGKRKHSVEGSSSDSKKRKKKRGSKLKNERCLDLPITIKSRSNSKSEKPPKAVKKNRKQGLSCERRSSLEIPSQGPTTECQEANFFVGEKHRKNAPETCGGYNTKRKKKKKHKLARSLVPSHAEDVYSPRGLPPTVKTVSHEMRLSHRKQTLVQDSVSKGKTNCVCCLTLDSQGTRNRVLEKGSADPVHKLQEENNCKQDHKGTALEKESQVTEQGQKKKWKKKKKKLKEEEAGFLLTSTGHQENHPAVSTETLWKPKSEGQQKKLDMTQNAGGDRKSPKKRKVSTKVADSYPHLLENHKGEKAKKKRKKSKEQGPALWENSDKQCDAPMRTARKRGGSEGPEEEPCSKQAKLKEEEREDEVRVIAVKKGNCDEIKIDKMRRQALQQEIDRESGKTNAINVEDESDHHFGQWSTATFDSTERKTKFLRLLGGFKKGPASIQESAAKVPKRNMALAKRGQENLQQTLQAEFEKALGWKQWQGAGLGFQPAPQKRVYIDKYASKSVKFVE